MKDAFGSDIRNLPDFPALLTVIQGGAQGSGLPGSAQIRSMIHNLELAGGNILLNPDGAGHGTFNDGHNVYLDPNLLPPDADNAKLRPSAD